MGSNIEDTYPQCRGTGAACRVARKSKDRWDFFLISVGEGKGVFCSLNLTCILLKMYVQIYSQLLQMGSLFCCCSSGNSSGLFLYALRGVCLDAISCRKFSHKYNKGEHWLLHDFSDASQVSICCQIFDHNVHMSLVWKVF